MGTDIHAPLGQDRKARPQPAGPSRFSARNVVSAAIVAGLLGFSSWTALAPSGLITTPLPIPAQETASNDQTADKADQKVAVAKERVPRTSGLSGARVEETLTDDGNVVRTNA